MSDSDLGSIRITNLAVNLGGLQVLHDVNLTADRGDLLALLGPNGAGKTTILRLVMTLEELTGGYIWIDGQPLTHDRRDGRRIRLREKEVAATRRVVDMVAAIAGTRPPARTVRGLA